MNIKAFIIHLARAADRRPQVERLTRDLSVQGPVKAEVIDAVDNHSPIELTFNASPSIIVETLENQVCSIHAVVATDEAARLHRANSERLLQFLIEPAEWAVTGHVQLRERDNRLILHAQVREDAAAEPEPFAQALTDFYDRIKLCREHLRA